MDWLNFIDRKGYFHGLDTSGCGGLSPSWKDSVSDVHAILSPFALLYMDGILNGRTSVRAESRSESDTRTISVDVAGDSRGGPPTTDDSNIRFRHSHGHEARVFGN